MAIGVGSTTDQLFLAGKDPAQTSMKTECDLNCPFHEEQK